MTAFSGFPAEALDFLADLSLNNHKPWFDEHRAEFDNFCMGPSRAFVDAFGALIHRHRPDVVADPRTDRSIFRLHRDVRFSKDKSPFKTHLGFYFWEGPSKDSPGFYVQINPDRLFAGVGCYMFNRDQLRNYRSNAAAPASGKTLRRAVDQLAGSELRVMGAHYKRPPAGVAADHMNADLLLHNGLWLSLPESALPDSIHSADFAADVFERLVAGIPVHTWLVEHL